MGLATNTYKYELEKKNKLENMVFMQFRIQVDLSTIISHKDQYQCMLVAKANDSRKIWSGDLFPFCLSQAAVIMQPTMFHWS